MPKIRYVGPHDAVELLDGRIVERGHQIEVSDELAGKRPSRRIEAAMAELGEAVTNFDHHRAVALRKEIAELDHGSGLLAQDTWEAVTAKKDEVDK